MKKLFTLIVGALCCFSAMATTFTFTSAESVTQTTDGYTVKIEKGSGNNAPAYYDNGLRLYASNTITISGTNLTNIELTFSMQGSKAYADLTANPGTLVSGGASTSQTDLKTDTWTGNATSVTFTLGASGQRLINKIVVNGDGSEGGNTGGGNENPSGPTDPDSPSLNPDYNYAEPTVVNVPSTIVQGAEYTFIDNNIEVSCTKGAITDSYFSVHAGFAMTFTATKNIKGIVINGFVKKDFTATADHGKISYLTPAEDKEANPVVVITDVNSKSVTIDCVKQLRCYNVEVYFDENPEATVSGAPGSGEEITLNFDSADAVYESEYAEMIGEPNYLIFLYNESDPEIPYFALDIYPVSKDNLAGTYTWDDWNLGDYTYYAYGYNEEDVTWIEDGEVTITKSGNNYTISGSILCDNGNIYNIYFSGEMSFYTDDEYFTSWHQLEFDSAEAYYDDEFSEEIGRPNYTVVLFNEANPDFPCFVLDIYPESKDDLTGSYSTEDENLGDYTFYITGEGVENILWGLFGEANITRDGDTYSITASILCEDYDLYTISFTGMMPIYDDSEDSTVKDIVVEETEVESPAYDLQGRPVGKSYRGIVIRGGKKELIK